MKRKYMKLFGIFLILFSITFCAQKRGERNYIQEYPLKKSQFNGTWYYQQTVVDAPYEAFWAFEGLQGSFPYIYKIKWVIEKDRLIGYETYTRTKGTEYPREQNDKDFLGEPVVAFKIESHFDLQRDYNAVTGEEYNVETENTRDRLWWQREYMRVDFSENLYDSFDYGYKLTTNPVTFYEQNPDDYQAPNFVYDNGELVYFDVVTKVTITPDLVECEGIPGSLCYQAIGQELAPAQVAIRHSFLKIREKSTYEPMYYPDNLFEKFGYFRQERNTWNRYRGRTDFLDYWIDRWNIWADDVTECRDFSKEHPYEDCKIKQIVYYLSPAFPERYKAEAQEVVDWWDAAFEEMLVKLKGQAERVFVLKDNNCSKSNVKEWLSKHEDYQYLLNGNNIEDLTDEDLLKLCRDLAGATRQNDNENRFEYQRLGDLRYPMINYVFTPSIGMPLGYGPSSADIETGEIVHAVANIYGGALETYRGYLYDIYDLIKDNISDMNFAMGESVREYMQNMGKNVFPERLPQEFLKLNLDKDAAKKFAGRIRQKFNLLDEFNRMPASSLRSRLDALKGSSYEDLLLSQDELLFAHGFSLGVNYPGDIKDLISPMRGRTFMNEWAEMRQKDRYNTILRLDSYYDFAIEKLIYTAEEELGIDHSDTTHKKEVADWIIKKIFKGVLSHEVGHTLGLRHNFIASFDEENYRDEYWDILNGTNNTGINPDQKALPYIEPPTGDYTGDDWQQYLQQRKERKREQELAGIDFYKYSSVMDYDGEFYNEVMGLGKYDHAAIRFGYGMLMDIYNGEPNESKSNRDYVFYYPGGSFCETDQDCPGYQFGQTCQIQDNGKGLCSNWEDDMQAKGIKWPHYKFCSDERVYDQPFCNVWDEGRSSLEIVENTIEQYERRYIFNNFRRYRATFPYYYINRLLDTYYRIKIQLQALMYNIIYKEDFVDTDEFADMFAASITGLNFFAKVLSEPSIGTYKYNAYNNTWELCSYYTEDTNINEQRNDCNTTDPSQLLQVPLGFGKYYWTVFEQGYYGQIYRIARVGTYYDKVLAMDALTAREWYFPFANNVIYPLNYYDAFPNEVTKLFKALIENGSTYLAPLVDVTYDSDGIPHVDKIEYKDYWEGDFLSKIAGGMDITGMFNLKGTGKWDTPVEQRYAGRQMMEPPNSIFYKIYALLYGAGYNSIWFDTTFNDSLQLYVFGSSDKLNDAIDTLESQGDLVIYKSPFRSKIYVGVQDSTGDSIAYNVVKEAKEYAQRCLNGQEGDYCSYRIDSRESFMNIMYDMLRDMGILTYAYVSP